MSDWVLDASAVLALLNAESGAEAVQALLPASISSVNLTEVVSRLVSYGMPENEVRGALSLLALEIVPFDENQAYLAGLMVSLTRSHELSLGDRACLALAQRQGATAVTADQTWIGLGIGAKIQMIR